MNAPCDDTAEEMNTLIGAIWSAMDAGLDDATIRDVMDQAIDSWTPDDESINPEKESTTHD